MSGDAASADGRLWVGTSGWVYPDWRGVFYPSSVKSADYLRFYSSRFHTTEINYSFYHVPKPETFGKWASQVPETFRFAVKVHRLITHERRLRDVGDRWRDFQFGARELGKKLGVFLLQFPPSFRCQPELLGAFLEQYEDLQKDRTVRMAFEFRHASWFVPEIQALLEQHGASMVVASSSRYPQAPLKPTASFVYLRFHGPNELFASSYDDEDLKCWAARIRRWRSEKRDVYAYFNNDFAAAAVANATRLLELV